MTSKVISSSKFILLGSVVSKIFPFAGSVVLARILFPEDYGYLTLTTVFTVFLQQIGNFGIEVFYLQEKTSSKEEEEGVLQIVFKLRLFTNAVLFAIQVVTALVFYFFLEKVIVGQLLLIFSFTYIFEILSSVNGAILKKELTFKPIAIANTARDVASVVSRVLFASLGFGPLSFGFGAVIGSFCQAVCIRYAKKMKVDWKFWDKSYFLRVYNFSKHVLLGSIGSYASQQMDKLIMVSFFDLSKIGFYSFGYSNAGIPFTYIFSPQQQLILSYSANLKDKPALLLERIYDMSRIIFLLTGPLYVLAYFNCDYIVTFVFGDKWLMAGVYVQVFIIYFFFLSFLTPFNGLLTALGRPDIVSKITLAKMIVLIPVLFTFAVFVDDLIWYCFAFSVISVLFDLLKANAGLKQIGGSVFSFVLKNSDVIFILVILSVLEIIVSSTDYLSPPLTLLTSLVLVLFFWIVFSIRGKDRELVKKIIFKR